MAYLKSLFLTITKNKTILFVFSRYATYFIHFINSLLIAVYLGPYYLGVWGFVLLVTQYMNHLSFGISDAVTAIISVEKERDNYARQIIGTAVTMLIGLSIMAIVFFVMNELFNFEVGSKYNFSTYAPIVLLIGVLGYFNTLFSSVYRVYGKLFEIAFNQTVFPVFVLFAILIFKNNNLIWALVVANFTAFLASFILFIVKSPVRFKPTLQLELFKVIQRKGWYLFVYNTSFYFIIISTRSLVSTFYSVEEFGYFTFAFTLANVMLLLLQSFSYLIFPKLLNLFSSSTNVENNELLKKLRDAYVTTSHLLIHIAILFFPIFLLLFPQYIEASEAFVLIALTIVLYTNSFGYSGLLIAKGHERRLSRVSLIALIINLVVAFILIKLLTVSFTLVIVATMVSYFIYVLILGYTGRKMLQLDTSFINVMKDIYPLRLLIPHLFTLGLLLFSAPQIYFAISLVLFLVFNFKVLLKLKNIIRTIILNPNFINI